MGVVLITNSQVRGLQVKNKPVLKGNKALPDKYEFGGAKKIYFDTSKDIISAHAGGSIVCGTPSCGPGTRLCASTPCT